MAPIATGFDTQELKRSIEERDASGQVALFADDAVVELIDKANPPSRPLVLKGDGIREWVEDITSRDMTHTFGGLVVDGDKVSYTVDCAYPDGSKVLCMASAELRDGKVAYLRGVQAWDE
jgi:hypothetical protein